MEWEGFKSGRDLFEELSQHMHGRTEESNEKPDRIAGVPAENRIQHFHNTSLESITANQTRPVERER
jgi:hypothetical protein